MPSFDATISIGNILTIVGFIIAAWIAGVKIRDGLERSISAMDKRVLAFEVLLSHHATTLVDHSSRMKKQDEMLIDLVGHVQRLIGRMEGSQQSTLDRAETVARGLIDHAAQSAKDTVDAAAQSARETLLKAAEVRASHD